MRKTVQLAWSLEISYLSVGRSEILTTSSYKSVEDVQISYCYTVDLLWMHQNDVFPESFFPKCTRRLTHLPYSFYKKMDGHYLKFVTSFSERVIILYYHRMTFLEWFTILWMQLYLKKPCISRTLKACWSGGDARSHCLLYVSDLPLIVFRCVKNLFFETFSGNCMNVAVQWHTYLAHFFFRSVKLFALEQFISFD